MYLVNNKCVKAVKFSNFFGHYLLNRSTLDVGVFGYIGIVQRKEHSPEVLSIPPGTSCICAYTLYIYTYIFFHNTGSPIGKRYKNIGTAVNAVCQGKFSGCHPSNFRLSFCALVPYVRQLRTRGWVIYRAGLDVVEKTKISRP